MFNYFFSLYDKTNFDMELTDKELEELQKLNKLEDQRNITITYIIILFYYLYYDKTETKVKFTSLQTNNLIPYKGIEKHKNISMDINELPLELKKILYVYVQLIC